MANKYKVLFLEINCYVPLVIMVLEVDVKSDYYYYYVVNCVVNGFIVAFQRYCVTNIK